MWYYVYNPYDQRNPYTLGPFRNYEDAEESCRTLEKVVSMDQPYRLSDLNTDG